MIDTVVYPTLLPALVSGDWSEAQRSMLLAADPAHLADWLVRQELGALSYTRLQAAGLAPALVAALAPAYWQQAAAITVKLDLLARLQTAFAAAGVETVLLKGIAFCLTLYPDPAVRPMNDLDFWIRPSDIAAAWQVMAAAGFSGKGLWPGPEAVPDHVTQLDFYPGLPQESPLNVEIHWDLTQRATVRGCLPLEQWWAQSRPLTWRGQTVRVLAPPAALVHAAVHQMLEHRGELRWRWLLDVDQLIRGVPGYRLRATDWDQVVADAEAAAVLPAVQGMLRLVADKLHTPLPEGALSVLAQAAQPVHQQRVADMARADRSPAGKVFLNAAYTSNWRQKTAVVRQILFPSPAYMKQRYQIRHSALLPAYYLGRLARGAGMAVLGRRPQERDDV